MKTKPAAKEVNRDLSSASPVTSNGTDNGNGNSTVVEFCGRTMWVFNMRENAVLVPILLVPTTTLMAIGPMKLWMMFHQIEL